MKTVFIQTNNKQLLGARLARYAIERNLKHGGLVTIKIMNVDEMPLFQHFVGKKFLREGKYTTYDPNDLQSFTMSRFLPPELMHYKGRAVVIDPDVFALTDINELFDTNLHSNALAACKKKGWATSVMLLDCSKLQHWNVSNMLTDISKGARDYRAIMSLADERNVLELPSEWNDYDHLDGGTKMLHTTGRLTQPWKTGLKIDFIRKDPGKLWGFIQKKPILWALGRWPMRYQPHPDKRIEKFFFTLLTDALRDGAVSEAQIQAEIDAGHVRPDMLDLVMCA